MYVHQTMKSYVAFFLVGHQCDVYSISRLSKFGELTSSDAKVIKLQKGHDGT